jgi:ABC-type transport system involved in multi-copper enzyme maturation permease subunit
MRQTLALVWKESREQLWFLLAGIALFFAPPLYEAVVRYSRGWGTHGVFYSNNGVAMVLGVGGLFAVMLAVAATCRDLGSRVETFWLSRPIGAGRLLASKFVVGLAVLLAVTCGVLVMQMAMQAQSGYPGQHLRDNEAASMLFFHTFTLTFVYSVSFLMGCLVRQSARSALLAVVAGVLVYFLPIVLPPLNSVSVFRLMIDLLSSDSSPASTFGANIMLLGPLLFYATMVLGSAACLAASIVAVRRQWRLPAGKKLICWLLVITAMLILGAGAVQVGSNLACKRSFEVVPSGDGGRCDVAEVVLSGKRGVMLAYPNKKRWIPDQVQLELCAFELSDSGLQVGPGVPVARGRWPGSELAFSHFAWSPQCPNRAYFLSSVTDEQAPRRPLKSLELVTVAIDPCAPGAIIHRLDLLSAIPVRKLSWPGDARMCLYEDRIYIRAWTSVLVIGLANPDAPDLTRNINVGLLAALMVRRDSTDRDILTGLRLLPLEGLPPRQRLELTMRLGATPGRIGFEGDLVVEATEEGLTTYRVGGMEVDIARLDLIARRPATPLRRMLDSSPRRVVLHEGLAYALEHEGLTVYDVRDPSTPRRLAHYAAGGQYFHDMAILPDGSIVLAGTSLQVIEPVKLGR